MNAEEAKLIEEKLQGILKSIEDYGNQVEQFGKARAKLDDVLETNNKLSGALNDLTVSCNDLIKDVKAKVYDDTFAAIKDETEKIQSVSSELKVAFESASGQMVGATKDIQSGIHGLVNSFGEAFVDLKNKLEELKNSLFDVQNILREDVKTAKEELSSKIDNSSKQSTQKLEALNKELEVQKASTKKEISTNRKLLIVGIVLLTATLIVSVVGLFI